MAEDAFLVPTLDQEVIDNFNCLQTTGDYCDPRRVELEPFVQTLPFLQDADTATDRFGNPVLVDNLPGMPFSNSGRPHQRFDDFFPDKLYEVHVRLFGWRFHPDLAPSNVYGYSDMSPGPLYKAHYGEPIVVRQYNDLDVGGDGSGFGRPETITHLHNAHTPSESDGFPGDFYPGLVPTVDAGLDGVLGNEDDIEVGAVHPGPDYIMGTDDDYLTGLTGEFHDHHYPNVLAGGDPNEALNTLWYHDHRGDFTAQNTYKGLVGMYLLFDEVDSGDETDPNPNALHLPSGDYDIPMLFADKSFDDTPEHQLFMDVFNFDGFLGNHVTVNGAVKPYLEVDRRKYRLRLLNAGPSRFYQFVLSNGEDLVMIANDGNLLQHPVDMPEGVKVTPAERMDVIVDFSDAEIGDTIYLTNVMDQWHGAGPTGIVLPEDEGDRVIEFRVTGDADDPSEVPDCLRERSTIEEDEVERTRVFEFDNQTDGWTINGRQFDANRVDEEIPAGATEKWILRNTAKDWEHPVHIHLEEHQIVSRNGEPPPVFEGARKDVTVIGPEEEVVVRIRIRDWVGRYPMHCHNTVHEDHAMLIRWDVVADDDDDDDDGYCD